MASALGAAPVPGCPGLLALPGVPARPGSLPACNAEALLGSHASASTPMSCEMYLS